MTIHDLRLIESLIGGIQERQHIMASEHFWAKVTLEDFKNRNVRKLADCLEYHQMNAACEAVEDLICELEARE